MDVNSLGTRPWNRLLIIMSVMHASKEETVNCALYRRQACFASASSAHIWLLYILNTYTHSGLCRLAIPYIWLFL